MRYLLLRNNQEMGPYTLEELQHLRVVTTDLVWLEGQSEIWKYATEFIELKSILDKSARDDFQPASASSVNPALETKYTRSLDEIKEMYVHKLYGQQEKKKGVFSSQVFWVGLVGVILGAGSFFIFQYTATKMKPQKAEVIKPSSEIVIPHDAAAAISQDFKNALVTEVVDSSKLEPPKKPLDVKKQIELEANNYKVGLLGGVNNLQLIVVNNSDQYLDKVNIRVSYLKKNDEIIHSQIVTAEKIKPQDEETISVPDYKRGVKVSYKIQSVKSQPYKGALLEL